MHKINLFLKNFKTKITIKKILKKKVEYNNIDLSDLKKLYIENKRDVIELLSISILVIENIKEIELSKEQIIAALNMIEGNIVDMPTGSGKSFAILLSTLVLLKEKKQVKIITINEYLSKRDYLNNKEVFDYLNISNININSKMSDLDIKNRNKFAVIYSNASDLIFNSLRLEKELDTTKIYKENFDCLIIDEIDSILLDSSLSPLILSRKVELEKDFYVKSHKISLNLKNKQDYKIENKKIIINENGIKKIEKELKIKNIKNHKNIIWLQQIKQSLNAKHFYKKDKEYLIENNFIQLINKTTGRIDYGKRLSKGLQQAIEAKENVYISSLNEIINKTSYQSYIKKYDFFTGISGSIKYEKEEIDYFFNKKIIEIKNKSKITEKNILLKSVSEKINYIINELNKNSNKLPYLIYTNNVKSSNLVGLRLKEAGFKNVNILNAKNTEEEKDLIKKASNKDYITVITQIAGRGVDINISNEVNVLGGLQIIVFEHSFSKRLDQQIKGRTGRKGGNGNILFLNSPEDDIFKNINKESEKILEDILKTGKNIELLIYLLNIQQEGYEKIDFFKRKNIYEDIKYIEEIKELVHKERKDFLFENDIKKIKTKLEKIYNLLSEEDLIELNRESNKEFDYILKNNINEDNKELIKTIIIEIIDNLFKDYLAEVEYIIEEKYINESNKDVNINISKRLEELYNQKRKESQIELIKILNNYVFEEDEEDNIELSHIEKEVIEMIDFQNKETKDVLDDIINLKIDLNETIQGYINDIYYTSIYKNPKKKDILNILNINDTKIKKNDFKKEINKKIKEQLDKKTNKLEKKEQIIKEIIVGSVELNYEEYLRDLEKIMKKEDEINYTTKIEIENLFKLLKIKTKFDTIKNLIKLDFLLKEKVDD